MSLWKVQGSKKWEVDVSTEDSTAEEIVGLAWSPDGKRNPLRSFPCRISFVFLGQSIAVAHNPPRITLHSIQDGQEERALPIVIPSNILRRVFHITGVWWFEEERGVTSSSIPDIFKRNNVIVRSSSAQNVDIGLT